MNDKKIIAPIHLKIILEYTSLTIIFESRMRSSDIDLIILSSGCLEKMLELGPHFGKPKLTIERNVFCPKCKLKSPIELIRGYSCPECDWDLRKEMEAIQK